MLVWIEKNNATVVFRSSISSAVFYTMPVKAEHCCGDIACFLKSLLNRPAESGDWSVGAAG